ncbi:hypothetical protein BaRGS_00018540 [Batillaria attramentaria]|uniref:Uncharacterized protein n=1 Tax=Batillaria attramentaria TaxID=370345 RepID=A0ABD0KTN8_9CAEN
MGQKGLSFAVAGFLDMSFGQWACTALLITTSNSHVRHARDVRSRTSRSIPTDGLPLPPPPAPPPHFTQDHIVCCRLRSDRTHGYSPFGRTIVPITSGRPARPSSETRSSNQTGSIQHWPMTLACGGMELCICYVRDAEAEEEELYIMTPERSFSLSPLSLLATTPLPGRPRDRQ